MLVFSGSLVFGSAGSVLAVEDIEEQDEEEVVECEDVAVEVLGKDSPEDLLKECETDAVMDSAASEESVHIEGEDEGNTTCSEGNHEDVVNLGDEVKEETVITKDQTVLESSPSNERTEETVLETTVDDDGEISCSETDAQVELSEEEGPEGTSESTSRELGDGSMSSSEGEVEKEVTKEVVVDMNEEPSKVPSEVDEVKMKHVEKDEHVEQPKELDTAPDTLSANPSDTTEGIVRTASIENSPIIQTEIEIETVRQSQSSNEPWSNTNNASGSGDLSVYNGSENWSESSSDSNHSYSRPNGSLQSGGNSYKGTSTNRLPQTGGFMDQTRVIIISSLLIVLGVVLRLASSRTRKMN